MITFYTSCGGLSLPQMLVTWQGRRTGRRQACLARSGGRSSRRRGNWTRDRRGLGGGEAQGVDQGVWCRQDGAVSERAKGPGRWKGTGLATW